MRLALTLFPLWALCLRAQPALPTRPSFEDYPVAQTLEGAPAPVVLDTRDKRLYKTRITEASKQKPNFAGHYSVALWGCGSGCQAGAVVDLKTGRVTNAPQFHPIDERWLVCLMAGSETVDFRVDSRLFVVRCGYEYDDSRPDETFFVIEQDGAFREILYVPGNPPYRRLFEKTPEEP